MFLIEHIPDDFMQGFDRNTVTEKLKEIGFGDVAKKLGTLSNGEIENMIRQNPEILKKAAQIMKGEVKPK